jgi:hypothetical protein
MGDLVRTRIELDPLAFSTGNTHRTPGVHSTDVLRSILTAAGLMKDYAKVKPGQAVRTEEDLASYALQGYLWEDIYCEILAGRLRGRSDEYIRFGEIACPATPDDGEPFLVEYSPLGELVTPVPPRHILLTPDGLRIRPDLRLILAEFKWTTKSAKMNPEFDKREWFFQVKSYLHALSQLMKQSVVDVEWHVQFAAGEYQGTPPIYEEWTKDFSPDEIRDTWQMMISYVDDQVRKDPAHRWAQYW